MKIKNITIMMLGFLASSAILMAPLTAGAAWPRLPATQVNLMVVYGTNTYFISTLSGVPSGYDVKNGIYPGWCADRSVTMARNVLHSVLLYSSLSSSLPASISGINWKAINYILNHKQGSMMQIQEAIWYFTDQYSPPNTHTYAWAMINAAKANPQYVPGSGKILAVICYARNVPNVQDSLIELRVPLPGLSPGYWKHNVNVYNGGLGSYSGDPHITPAQLEAYAAYIKANFYSGFSLAWAQSRFQNNQYKSMWLTIANWFNAAAGRLPYTGD